MGTPTKPVKDVILDSALRTIANEAANMLEERAKRRLLSEALERYRNHPGDLKQWNNGDLSVLAVAVKEYTDELKEVINQDKYKAWKEELDTILDELASREV